MGRLAALSLAALALLPGCFFSSRGATFSESAEPPDALTAVRAAVPAIEAYYADNGTYAGMTVDALRLTYDAGLPEIYLEVRDGGQRYCVVSSAGGETYSKLGPQGDLLPGPCP